MAVFSSPGSFFKAILILIERTEGKTYQSQIKPPIKREEITQDSLFFPNVRHTVGCQNVASENLRVLRKAELFKAKSCAQLFSVTVTSASCAHITLSPLFR